MNETQSITTTCPKCDKRVRMPKVAAQRWTCPNCAAKNRTTYKVTR